VSSILVSTDDVEVAEFAEQGGVAIPELRPVELAEDTTPMADVIRYAVSLLDEGWGENESFILLLDPTSPIRDPEAIEACIASLRADLSLDGAVSVSRPSFNPLWVGVSIADDGVMAAHPMLTETYDRRQDVPDYWRINGSFYVWRRDYARSIQPNWPRVGRFLSVPSPELSSHSIDTAEDFAVVEALLAAGLVRLPWLEGGDTDGNV